MIPDTQAPFEHPKTLEFLKHVKNKYKPTEIVHIGDELDFHALSDYDSDPDGLSAGDELKQALANLKKLYKIFPKVKVCISNHTARPFRKALKYGIPETILKGYREILQAPKGWEWKDEWIIDDVIYTHGHNGYGGQYAHIRQALSNRKSTVIGHYHSNAGVIYESNGRELLWGMAVGCLLDVDSYAFRYNKSYPRKPILGCGVVVKGQPRFIPYER